MKGVASLAPGGRWSGGAQAAAGPRVVAGSPRHERLAGRRRPSRSAPRSGGTPTAASAWSTTSIRSPATRSCGASCRVQWPAAFALQLRMKGRGAVNDLQVKLVDASGDNVWWVNRPSFPLPRALHRRHLPEPPLQLRLGAHRRSHAGAHRDPGARRRGRAGRPGGAVRVAAARAGARRDPAVWPEPLVRRQAGTLTSTTAARASSTGSPCSGPGRRGRRATTCSPRRTPGAGGCCGGCGGARAASRRSSSRRPRPATCRIRLPGGASGAAACELRDAQAVARPQRRPLRARPARAARTRAARVPRRAELLDAGGRGRGWRALGAAQRGWGAGGGARRLQRGARRPDGWAVGS